MEVKLVCIGEQTQRLTDKPHEDRPKIKELKVRNQDLIEKNISVSPPVSHKTGDLMIRGSEGRTCGVNPSSLA